MRKKTTEKPVLVAKYTEEAIRLCGGVSSSHRRIFKVAVTLDRDMEPAGKLAGVVPDTALAKTTKELYLCPRPIMHKPPHPGESLREDVLPALSLSVTALAKHLGYSRGQLSKVINGKASISTELAHRLELAGLGAARVWLAQQATFDLWQVSPRESPAAPPP
jgi:addiction module HigA family antidote